MRNYLDKFVDNIRRIPATKMLEPVRKTGNPTKFKYAVNQVKKIKKWPKTKIRSLIVEVQMAASKHKSQLMRGNVPPELKRKFAALRRKYGISPPPKNLM